MSQVGRIPSINLPLVNAEGVIHPIWYEFFRSVISNLGASSGGTTVGNIIAGAGLIGGGNASSDLFVAVGAGAGILANTDSVSVDIIHQTNAQAALEDEILIADASDQSSIRKTSLRDVAALAGSFPGGTNTQIQYNNNFAFAGDTGFTTDGAGALSITGQLSVDNITINGNTLSTNSNANPFIFEVPAGALNQFTFTQSAAGSSDCQSNFVGLRASSIIAIKSDTTGTNGAANASLQFETNGGTSIWGMGLYDVSTNDDFVFAASGGLNVSQVYTISGAAGNAFTHNTDLNIGAFLFRKTTAGITASTTQTQGNGALTAEINEVATCVNANDTVTLPTASAGKHCLVINNGAATLQVFPASGDNLGAGLNTSTTIVTASRKLFIAFDATNWEPVI